MAGEIVKADYIEETVQRICLTYKLLNQIIDQKFIGRELTIWYRYQSRELHQELSTISLSEALRWSKTS